ncbi:DUF6925 family protein [Microbaculum sp. FT89]|uniref:DUF6925 family protein n=1 Tax=Microbaculum sp. FT89 TaxID=3447298 RepID=UPI003F530F29
MTDDTTVASGPHADRATCLATVIAEKLRDPGTAWSLGTFGAIAEFLYDDGEPIELGTASDHVCAATDRGAIRLDFDADMVAFAYETPNSAPDRWSHAVALCLPRATCAASRRTVLTELGPDVAAVRPRDREAILFDLGLGTLQVDACVRVSDPAVVTRFREWCGTSLFAPGNPLGPAMPDISPHRVFTCRFGRIEVFQPIPPADGRSPEGPHTHLMPKLLRTGQTHARTVPIPEHLVPCAYIHPPNPVVDIMGRAKPFDRRAFVEFQALLRSFGDPELMSLKTRLLMALQKDEKPGGEPPRGRHVSACVKLAERQHAAIASSGALPF